MGVQGLWQLLDPLGRPVNLESLQNKVLAVDASILLHQSVHGFRDGQGNPLSNAHLLGFFHRICKLLFYNIKPIFVFDGAVPLLKKHTLATRRDRQEIAVRDAEKTRRQILTKYMQSKVVTAALNSRKQSSTKSQSPDKNLSQSSATYTPDLFELPPEPPKLDAKLSNESDSEDEVSNQDIGVGNSSYQDLDSIDFDSQDFKSLPLEIQHEFLVELKERSKLKSWFKGEVLPQDAEKIGSFQVQQLLTRRKIRKRLEDLRKELDAKMTGTIISGLDDSELSSQFEDRFSVARRIVSEDFAHYLLFKNICVNKIKPERLAKQTKTLQDEEPLPSTSNQIIKSNSSLEPVQDSPDVEEISLEDEIFTGVVDPKVSAGNEADIAKWLQLPDEIISNEETNDEDIVITEMNIVDKNDVKSDVVPGSSRSDEVIQQSVAHNHSENVKSDLKNKDLAHSATSGTPLIVDPAFQTVDHIPDVQILKTTSSNSINKEIEVESSDDDFIEVTVDISKAEEDELFPIEIFNKSETDDHPSKGTAELVPDNFIANHHSEESSEIGKFLSNLPKSNAELESMNEELNIELENLVQEKGRKERIAATITDQMYVEGQELLRQFGVPFVISPAEAEAQCATLEMLGLTEGTITDDSDVWLFGSKCVYKNFFEKGRDPMFFCDSDVRERLNLNRSRLIAIAFLTGSDYTEGVKGVGVVKALELLAEFPEEEGYESLKRFRKWWDEAQLQKVLPSETRVKQFLRKVELKEGFPCESVLKAYMEPLVDTSTEKFSWSTPDLDALRQFASVKLRWNQEKVDSMLLPILKKLSSPKQKQLQLSHFGFTCTRDHQTMHQPSKRLVRALNKVRDFAKTSNVDEDAKKNKETSERPKNVIKKKTCTKAAGHPRVATRRRGRSVHHKAAKSTDYSNKDLELSESSDSSAEQNDDTIDEDYVAPAKRKR